MNGRTFSPNPRKRGKSHHHHHHHHNNNNNNIDRTTIRSLQMEVFAHFLFIQASLSLISLGVPFGYGTFKEGSIWSLLLQCNFKNNKKL